MLTTGAAAKNVSCACTQRSSDSRRRRRVLATLSGDTAALPLFDEKALQARVHSVFPHVVNLVTPAGRLFSLATAHLDDAPGTLVRDLDDWRGLRLTPGTEVGAHAGLLLVGDTLAVTVAGARRWMPPRLPTLRGSRLLSALLDDIVRRDGVAGGVLEADNTTSSVFAVAVADRLGQAVAGVRQALADDDSARLREEAHSLVGLGPGLTPSGDDFLAGLALVSATPGTPAAVHHAALREVVKAARARTNLISHAAMDHAVNGRSRQRIHRLLHALAAGEPHDIEAAARAVLAIGKTSGTDIVLGMQAGLRLDEGMRGTT
jgi:hypothetical protein